MPDPKIDLAGLEEGGDEVDAAVLEELITANGDSVSEAKSEETQAFEDLLNKQLLPDAEELFTNGSQRKVYRDKIQENLGLSLEDGITSLDDIAPEGIEALRAAVAGLVQKSTTSQKILDAVMTHIDTVLPKPEEEQRKQQEQPESDAGRNKEEKKRTSEQMKYGVLMGFLGRSLRNNAAHNAIFDNLEMTSPLTAFGRRGDPRKDREIGMFKSFKGQFMRNEDVQAVVNEAYERSKDKKGITLSARDYARLYNCSDKVLAQYYERLETKVTKKKEGEEKLIEEAQVEFDGQVVRKEQDISDIDTFAKLRDFTRSEESRLFLNFEPGTDVSSISLSSRIGFARRYFEAQGQVNDAIAEKGKEFRDNQSEFTKFYKQLEGRNLRIGDADSGYKFIGRLVYRRKNNKISFQRGELKPDDTSGKVDWADGKEEMTYDEFVAMYTGEGYEPIDARIIPSATPEQDLRAYGKAIVESSTPEEIEAAQESELALSPALLLDITEQLRDYIDYLKEFFTEKIATAEESDSRALADQNAIKNVMFQYLDRQESRLLKAVGVTDEERVSVNKKILGKMILSRVEGE